jgi:hypothetical protein
MRYLLLALTLLGLSLAAWADTAIGDWGHFVLNNPRILLNNPAGKAFSVTVHVMRWPIAGWNPTKIKVTLTDPDGKTLIAGEREVPDNACTLEVPAGAKGVYRLQLEGQPQWVSATLDEAVLWTGDPTRRHNFRERFAPAFQMAVPRTWWFFVPEGVTRFSVKAQRSSEYMSQREDWGIFIISPRGQRIRALWGQPPVTPPQEYLQDMTAEVEVEPGAGGRFWAVQLGFGDSHNYSKPNLCFDGIPPYLARSPEEWFDPATGAKPPVKVYDDDPFIQSARNDEVMKQRWPNLQHFSPCPSLGDPDGVEILGDARFALWNPDDRALRFRIGTYLPRLGMKTTATAAVKVTGADKRTVLDIALPVLHLHGTDGQPTDTLKTGKGVAMVSVAGAERWIAFTYPATPLVLLGQQTEGWAQFRLSAATARNWYFFVPKGTTQFSVRVAAAAPEDVVRLEVNAPDRTMAIIYDQAGEKTITVPAGLDNTIWHLRPEAGSASRIVTQLGPDCRYQDLLLTIGLKGVPGYLAPTWEQWFNPTAPVAAGVRAKRL